MPGRDPAAISKLNGLRTSVISFLAIGFVIIFGVYQVLENYWDGSFAIRWAMVASAALILQFSVLWRDLPLNKRTAKSPVLSGLGAGTLISLTRVAGISLLVGFLGLPLPPHWLAWLPFSLCLVFNLSDFIDGYVARITNQVTLLGQKLDQDLDGRGLLVAAVLAIQYGAAGWWFVLVGLARYFFIFGLALRRRRARIYRLRPNPARRALAGTQMGITTGMLAPILSPAVTILSSTLFMVPFLWNFYLDWLQVNGQTKLEKHLRTLQLVGWNFFQGWLPTVLRTLVFGLLSWQVIAGLVAGPFFAYQLILAGLIAFGVAPRITSIAVLVETAMRLRLQPIHFSDPIVIVCATGILFLGSGSFSLWQPEDKWATRRPGEKSIK